MKLHYFESQIKMPLMVFPLRSTVIQADAGVFIISPIDFSPTQIEKIKSLGKVVAIVAPNLLHHLHVKKAKAAFSSATVWAAPGLKEKDSSLPIDQIFGQATWPYQNELQAVVLNGFPKMNETVFYCPSQKTLIVTDLIFNVREVSGVREVLVTKLMGTYQKLAVSRLISWITTDKAALRQSVQQILSWDFDQIVMAHGEIVRTGGKGLLTQAFKERFDF